MLIVLDDFLIPGAWFIRTLGRCALSAESIVRSFRSIDAILAIRDQSARSLGVLLCLSF